MSKFLQTLIPPNSPAANFDLDSPTEILHEHTKWHRATFEGQLRSIVRYLVDPVFIARGAAGRNVFPTYPKIVLPDAAILQADLASVLASRRSIPGLAGKIDLKMLSALLHHSLRVNREVTSAVTPKVSIGNRPYPSPGGLYPTEFYLLINRVEQITPCIAHYNTHTHELAIICQQHGDAFKRIEIPNGEGRQTAPLIIVLTSVTQRATRKYGGRGYRMSLLEAGHASQNICLVAQGLGLGALVYGSYFDDELADELGIDGVTEAVMSVILIGEKPQ